MRRAGPVSADRACRALGDIRDFEEAFDLIAGQQHLGRCLQRRLAWVARVSPAAVVQGFQGLLGLGQLGAECLFLSGGVAKGAEQEPTFGPPTG